MNTPKNIKILLLVSLLFFLSYEAMAQSRAERRAEQKKREASLKAEVSKLINSGNFSLILVYIPAQDINLSSGNTALQEKRTITIRNDSIIGELPFVGRSSISSYQSTRGGGFIFNDPIRTGTIKQRSRNFLVSLIVNQPAESLDISIEIGFTGEVSMVIRSSRRANARYIGVLQPAR
jgi:hypothetical protein